MGFSLPRRHGLSSCIVWAELSGSLWDFNSLNRDQTHAPCIGRQIFNHWTTREVLILFILYSLLFFFTVWIFSHALKKKNLSSSSTISLFEYTLSCLLLLLSVSHCHSYRLNIFFLTQQKPYLKKNQTSWLQVYKDYTHAKSL